MVNKVHLRVVLRKDYLILKRRRGFCVALFLIPPILMMLAVIPVILQSEGTYTDSMFWNNFKITGNNLLAE